MTHPAGWFNDPWHDRQLRYWDGTHWTAHTAGSEGAPRGPFGRWRRRRKVELKASGPLVSATYRMLLADRWLVAFMLLGSVVAAAASAAIVGPAMLWGGITPAFSITSGGVTGVLVAAVALGVSTFVLQLTTGAVVAAALMRAEGSSPSLRRALGVAWSRRRQILAWALMSTVVGVAVRMLERLGIGGVIAAVTLNIGWAAATVFAMPVVIVEGTMPVETVRRSARVLKETFGATLFSSVRLAIPWMVAFWITFVVACAGGLMLAFGDPATAVVGGILLVIGIVGFAFCVGMSSALSAYLQTYLYRYATGGDVPGVDRGWLPPLAKS